MNNKYLHREDARFGKALWDKLDETIVSAAKARLTGRRLLPVDGPYGPGIKAIGTTDQNVAGTLSDRVRVHISVFASTATQHGGQETTITSFYNTLIHLGMIVVGVPYSEKGLLNMTEITGGTPYGATTLAKADGSRKPSENELSIARFQGQHVATLAAKMKGN